jgi:hypothetical protein
MKLITGSAALLLYASISTASVSAAPAVPAYRPLPMRADSWFWEVASRRARRAASREGGLPANG